MGFQVRIGCWPAAIATIIVSPTARETARMKAAVMPENAAGTTTRRLVCILVAPSAYDPSRRPFGTARIASSLSDDTSGRIMIPMTIPGLSALKVVSVGRTLLKERRDEEQCEVAVDDRRDAGKQLEDRLEDAPHAASWRTR